MNWFQSLISLFSNTWITRVAIGLSFLATGRIFYFFWQTYFLSNTLVGDEGVFYASFQLLLNEGWYAATAAGSSPFYNLLGYILYFFLQDANYALKAVGLLSWLLTLIVWGRFAWKKLGLQGLALWQVVGLLAMAGIRRNHYFKIVNDGLFVLLLSLLFFSLLAWYEERTNLSKSQKNAFLAGLWLALAISTREVILLYLPGTILWISLIIYKSKPRWQSIFGFLLALVVTIGLIHFPALNERGVLSIEQKQPEDAAVHWSQRLYLTVYEGRDYPATEEETLIYLQENGEDSLPRGYLISIFFNPRLTIENFFFSLSLVPKPFLRTIGIFFPLFFFGVFVLRKKEFNKTIQLGFVLTMLLLLSFSGAYCIQLMQDMQFRRYLYFVFALPVFCTGLFWGRFNQGLALLTTLANINLILLGIANLLLQGIW